MATSRVGDWDDQVPELWGKSLFFEAQKLTTLGSYEGPEGSGMPIIRKDDLTKQPGDTIRSDIVLALTGAGQSGDTSSLEGNEEAIKPRQSSYSVRQAKHAVRWTELAQHRSMHDKRTVAKRLLSQWLAARLDTDKWDELTGNTKDDGTTGVTIPDGNKWACGSASSRATIADGDTTGRLTTTAISEMKAYAQEELKLKPIMLAGGQEFFVLLINPYAALSMKINDSTWKTAMRESLPRDANHPLFTGAMGMWDGVILRPAQRVPRATNGSVQVADNVFLGAEAMSYGYSQYPSWREEDFDYGTETGIAVVLDKGEACNVFDLTSAGGAAASAKTAIGHMVVYSAAVAPSQP